MNRDYFTGLDLSFEPIFQPSDDYAMYQLQRAKPKRRKVKKGNPNEKRGGRIAIMQALRYHFGKSCMEIAQVMQMRGKYAGRIVSRMTLGGDPDVGRDWWRREYKQDAIDAAEKLLREA